jgi:energy-coupling factor transporter ATP-binding protein EcfA2
MITVDHLTKRYRTLTAVDGLSFEVGPGRVTGFLGPNGAGKTTTLRMLLGLAAPTSGTATVNGARYRDLRNPVHTVGQHSTTTISTRAAPRPSTCGSWPPRPGSARPTLEIRRTGWCEMPNATQIIVAQPDMTGGRCRALFCSVLQPSDTPTADMVATAISRAVQRFGIGGCAGRMAQEFGDHPEAAAARMRWVCQLLAPRPATGRQEAA